MKKLFAMLLTGAMVVSMCACGGAKQPAATQATQAAETTAAEVGAEKDTSGNDDIIADGTAYWPDEYLKEKIVIGTSSDGQTFSPTARASWGAVSFCVFEKLIVTDNEGKDRLQLLKSVNQKDDLTYECELWDCIYDTEGNNLKADDVKFSIQLYVDNGNAGGVNNLNLLENNIVDIDITGDYTFTWHCSKAFGAGDFSKNFGNPNIITAAAWEKSGEDQMATNPVGTGPYKLKEYVVGSKSVFEANEDYWMKNVEDEEWLAENFYVTDCQNVKEIEYDIIQDAATRAMALEMGDICAMDTANAADIEQYLADPSYGIKAVYKKVGAPVAYYYNCNDESICSDINMRMAIAYAIDQEALAAGNSYPSYAIYGIQPNMYDTPKEWVEGREYYDYDVEKSKEYQEKAGYNGEPLTIMYMEQGATPDALILMQAQLREAGINLELLPVDFNGLNSYKLQYDKWDMISEIMGGGNWMAQTIKKFWIEDSKMQCNGKQVTGINDEKLDELYVAVRDDNSEENIKAWDDYFTYEKLYGYGLLRYFEQTACRSSVNAVTFGAQNQLVGGAFTFNE